MSKRNDPASRPRAGEWELLLATRDVATGRDVLYEQQSDPLAEPHDRLRVDRHAITDRDRQGPLKVTLATARIGGRDVPQWQYELAGGARVRYAIDDASRKVWVTKASPRHPNETKR